MTRKVNYLNNKDLLLEIQRSKNSFSSFTSATDRQYDLIVSTLDKINSKTISEARAARAKRLAHEAFESAKESNAKVRIAEFEVDPKSLAKTDLVFRVMTFDHIPDAPGRKKSVKTVADGKERVNFPPFQHWRFDENDQLVCVGKSHWKGDVNSGKFNKEHGQITNNLARMYIKLCERYATRGNVRGYTYNEEMRGQAILQLTQIGLQFDESKSDNPFAYFTAAVTNAFVRVINTEKKMQNIRDDILEMNGMSPSYTRVINAEHEAAAKRDADTEQLGQ